jgi:hypothetical protein
MGNEEKHKTKLTYKKYTQHKMSEHLINIMKIYYLNTTTDTPAKPWRGRVGCLTLSFWLNGESLDETNIT